MKSKWTRYSKYLKRHWKLEAIFLGCGFLIIPFSLINPYLAKLIIDNAYGGRNLRLFLILFSASAMIFILTGLIDAISKFISRRIKKSVTFDITKDLFAHIQGLRLRSFRVYSTGEYIHRIHDDVGSTSDFICEAVPGIITIFPRFIFTIIVVFMINWKLAIAGMVLAPFAYIHYYFFGKRLTKVARHNKQRIQAFFKAVQEILSHFLLVRVFGKEAREEERIRVSLKERLYAELEFMKVFQSGTFVGSILNKAVGGLVALYGGYLVIKGRLTLGSFTAVMIYFTQFMGLLKAAGSIYETLTVASVSRKRIDDIFAMSSSVGDDASKTSFAVRECGISFKNASFGYEKTKPVLRGTSFLIEPASKIALVGPSGCGKTTILSLILKLYDLWDGAICVGGRDIKEIGSTSLRTSIGAAMQQSFLWNDSVRRNITYGAEKAGEQDIVRAARVAAADDFIDDLPDGYETVIGDMACKISEGQKQRIALARAFVKRPKIILLDEAISSVDSATENLIIDNMKEEFRDSTIVLVSHRLSAVKKMDSVLFFDAPDRLVKSTHDELLACNKRYQEMFAKQIVDFQKEFVGEGAISR